MENSKRLVSLNLDKFEDKGLYIIFNPKNILSLTDKIIHDTAENFLSDSSKISNEVKNNLLFQRCNHCPKRQEKTLCDSLRTILPFMDTIDKYKSYDKILILYRGNEKQLYYLSDTTMQVAFQYTAILTLTQYCQFGIRYKTYFYGVVPVMSAPEVAKRIYLNAYFLHKGNEKEINSFIKEFSDGVLISSTRQVERLRLICKNDIFMNSFVTMQMVTQFLTLDIAKEINEEIRQSI